MRPLTAEQMRRYEEDGYLLVSGLIAPRIVELGEAAMWRSLGALSDDPATWKEARTVGTFDDPAILACYTPEMLAVVAQLAGEDVSPVHAPSRAFAINVYPQEGPWQHHGPHIDHAIKKDGYKTFPRPFHVATIAYLNDVARHGAGTVVWPGSHKKIEALAKSDLERFEYMWVLNEALDELDLGEPLELLGKQGDVLFYHYLCAHSGSTNASDRPRLALVSKW